MHNDNMVAHETVYDCIFPMVCDRGMPALEELLIDWARAEMPTLRAKNLNNDVYHQGPIYNEQVAFLYVCLRQRLGDDDEAH